MNRRGFIGALLGGAALALTRTPYPIRPIEIEVFATEEITFSMEELDFSYLRPLAIQMANLMDRTYLELCQQQKNITMA